MNVVTRAAVADRPASHEAVSPKTLTRGNAVRSASVRAAAAAVVAMLVLAGCSSEIKGLDEDTAASMEAATAASPAPSTSSDPGFNVEAPDDPDPVVFALEDCLRVDFSGVGVRFDSVVPCDEAHHAEAYHSLEVEAEQTASDIADICGAELSSGYRDPSAGTFYALESPVNFVYNQGLTTAGDEVFCVYVHAEERSSAM